VSIEASDTAPATTFEVRLEQGSAVARAGRGGGLVSEAMACGDRTLVRSAGACISSTSMPLTGQVTGGDAALDGMTVTGTLHVIGVTFMDGELWLTVGPYRLFGSLSSAGLVSSLHTTDGSSRTAPGVAATMTRIAR
jgi:hypothetical protein